MPTEARYHVSTPMRIIDKPWRELRSAAPPFRFVLYDQLTTKVAGSHAKRSSLPRPFGVLSIRTVLGGFGARCFVANQFRGVLCGQVPPRRFQLSAGCWPMRSSPSDSSEPCGPRVGPRATWLIDSPWIVRSTLPESYGRPFKPVRTNSTAVD